MVLRGYRITHISPCLADPEKIRAIVELDEEIHEAFPYINALLKGCIYNHPDMMMALKKDGKMITLYPRKVTVAKAVDEKYVHETLEWLKDLTREISEKKGQIKPDYSRKARPTPADMVNLLPETNCKVCDELNCLAFAAKMLGDEKSVVRCAPLFTPEYKEKRQLLMEVLRATGYPVPGIRE
jgi:ArsR family metal-binding transcriptional regulator